MELEYFDVLIMGAGLSGIGAAHYLQKHCPNKSYIILEQRDRIGGTWDLFRYPGIRSDSDMFTMGYSFRPWTNTKAIAPGEDIRAYITATAEESGIDRHIRYRHQIKSAAWSSQNSQWQVKAIRRAADGGEEPVTLTCSFLFSCAGYYRYAAGYLPEFPEHQSLPGSRRPPASLARRSRLLGKARRHHRQRSHCRNAVTPIGKTAAHVIMLQRSPRMSFHCPNKIALPIGFVAYSHQPGHIASAASRTSRS